MAGWQAHRHQCGGRTCYEGPNRGVRRRAEQVHCTPGLGRARELPVRLPTEGDFDDGDDADPVADGIEDAVRTDADAVSVGGACELEAALRPRVRGELFEGWLTPAWNGFAV